MASQPILPLETIPSNDETPTAASISSGPGGPIFQFGTQTRIYRAPVRAIASARFDGRETFGQIVDISLGGCLFKTETTMEPGTELDLRITIIAADRRAVAEVRGVVCRRTEAEGRNAYGVEFLADDPAERRSLEWLYSQALR